MIETVLLNYIETALAAQGLNIPVCFEVPKTAPETFVKLERTGGGLTDYIHRATFAVQSYAPTLEKAAQLDALIVGIVLDSPACAEICAAHLNSHYNYTDTTTKRYRYQAVFDISHY